MKNGLFGDNDNGDDCENLLLGLDVPQGHNGHDTAKAGVLKLSGRMLSTIGLVLVCQRSLYTH